MRRCVCAFGCCCLACSLSLSLSLPLTSVFHCIHPLSQDPLKHGVFPLSLVSLFLCRQVGVAGIRVFPAACSICPPPSLVVRPLFRWLSPPPLACCRWSLVVIK
ncbi:hypothetical protein GQ42DRAFT_160381 [Ramicandelaber brevisporus]|nr:hypothetical protein GQ42DRAFT_160381 [Ramicandelaber brevisporus]